MDDNEFSFDALLNCDEFTYYESFMTHYAKDDFFKALEECVSDEKALERIKRENKDMMYCVFSDGFKQGFCFAVKSVKFLLKI